MEIFNYPSEAAEQKVLSITERGLGFTDEMLESVTEILEDVRKNGDNSLMTYINKFDAPELSVNALKVSPQEFEKARGEVGDDFIQALDRAVNQIESFHKKQQENSWIDTPRNGVILGQVVNPVEAAGIYVPGATGGNTPLVSSVLMGGIPARVAGVEKISLTTPPRPDGSVNPHILVAAERVGIHTVYKAGSAWGIAAMTYGTETIGKVDVIAGPGNIYVTLAKKIVSGTVAIDMIAGPSEILVIADETANPEYIAADLLSQAEHDTLASSILVTTSQKIAEETTIALKEQLAVLPRRKIAEQSIRDFSAIMVVPDLETGIELANRLAPEHLELLVNAPFEHMGKIRNAGAIFMGDYAPEPMGDYIAGPNHVLPTAGTARFASALSVEVFTKKTSIIHYSREAFLKEAEDVITLAEIEGLGAHANSVRIRLKK